MFKLRFSYDFNRYFQNAAPFFERVKKKGENPAYLRELREMHSSNVEGIPLHSRGSATVTPVYRVVVYCDVCELPVGEQVLHGESREVQVEKTGEMQSGEYKRSVEKGDEAVLKNLQKFFDLKKSFKPQCPTCGRWAALEHGKCFDDDVALCAGCAGVLKKFGEER